MSERLLEAFREEAEWLTAVPPFELIEQQGRALRRRRRAVVGACAASVLAVTAMVVTASGEPRSQRPSAPAPSTPSATPYPGPDMTTLPTGTYELAPGFDQSRPLVRFTVPAGWNAWQGPNRFEGIGPEGTDNDDVLDETAWYAGLLVFEVDRITQRDCVSGDMTDRQAPALVRALGRIPHLDVISGPESTVRFGHPAVHLRLRQNSTPLACGWTFRTPWGYTGGGDASGGTFDAWVVDMDDRPLVVWAEWSPLAPRTEVDAVLGIVDSLEIVDQP